MTRIVLLALLIVPAPLGAGEPVSFLRDVAPILRENCLACHNAQKHKGNLRMTSYKLLMQGGDRGEAVVAGKPEESSLYMLVSGMEEPRMPPKDAGGPLSAEKARVLERWIKEGAKFDGTSPEADLLTELRKLWNPPAPPEKYARPHPVRALAFSPDGERLLVGGHHELLVWHWQSGALGQRISTRAERTNAVLFVDDATLAVAGGRPGQEGDVRLYRLPKLSPQSTQRLDGTKVGEVLQRELLQIDDEVLSLALSPDRKRLASGATDRLVRVWELAGGEPKVIENHSDWVLSVSFAPEGTRLITTSRDRTAKVWDLEKGASVFTFPDHQSPVNGAAVKDDGKLIVTGGEDGQLRAWTGEPGSRQLRALGGRKPVTRVAFRPGTSQLLATYADGAARVINIERGNFVHSLNGHRDWIYALTISRDGKYAATGSWDGEVRVWNLDTGKLAKAFLASPGLMLAKRDDAPPSK
jgi:WD40 repeat protein